MKRTYIITFAHQGINATKELEAYNLLDAIFLFSIDYPIYKISKIEVI